MALGPNEVRQIIAEIWKMILGEEVEVCDDIPQGMSTDNLAGCVQITGNWRGTVSLHMSASLGRKLTANMMALKQSDDVTSELFHDTIGELVNMFAGNIRAILPPPCYLTLPVIGDCRGFAIEGSHHRNVARVAFRSCQEVFWACITQGSVDRPESILTNQTNLQAPVQQQPQPKPQLPIQIQPQPILQPQIQPHIQSQSQLQLTAAAMMPIIVSGSCILQDGDSLLVKGHS